MISIDKKWVEKAANENPHLRITCSRIEKNRSPFDGVGEHDRIEVTGFPFSPRVTAFFYEELALDILLANLSNLKNIIFVRNQALIINEHQLFAILDVPYIEAHSGPFVFKSSIPFEEYKITQNDLSYDVSIGGFSPTVMDTMEMTSSIRTEEEFIAKYRSQKDENLLRKAWGNFLYSWLIGSIDRGPVIANQLKRGDLFWRPYIIRDACNILLIEAEGEDTSGVEFLEKNYDQIINSVLLDYYQAHDLVAKIPYLKSSSVSLSDLCPNIPDRVHDRKLTTSRLRNISSEVINYLYVAESSDSPSFRFLSYYNIIEFFFAIVEYEYLQIEIKKVLESSDLSERIDYYSMKIAQYLNEIKLPHLRGEDKLRRVIQRYIPFSTFPESIPKDMKQAFKSSLKFDGGLKLQSVNMSNEDNFFGDLTRRIYSLRNSLVHSTMELSEIKRSVSTSSDDQDKLSVELNLIRLVAKEIMTRSSLRDEL